MPSAPPTSAQARNTGSAEALAMCSAGDARLGPHDAGRSRSCAAACRVARFRLLLQPDVLVDRRELLADELALAQQPVEDARARTRCESSLNDSAVVDRRERERAELVGERHDPRVGRHREERMAAIERRRRHVVEEDAAAPDVDPDHPSPRRRVERRADFQALARHQRLVAPSIHGQTVQ